MKLSYYLFFALQMAIGALSTQAYAQQQAAGGTIRFQGQIVEPVCGINTADRQLTVTCVRDGQAQTYHRALGTSYPQEINSALFEKTSLQYLDAQRTLGIYTVRYR